MNVSFTSLLRCDPIRADRLMVAVVVANALVAAWLLRARSWVELSAVAAAVAIAAGTLSLRGRYGSRFIVTAMLLVTLGAQSFAPQVEWLVQGNLALSLVLLLYYRDWRVVALVAGAGSIYFATVSSSPQAIGECVLMGLFALVLCPIAAGLERRHREAMELEFLVNAMGRDGPIRLDLDVVRAITPAGQRLKHVQQRMAMAMREVRQASQSVQQAALEVARHSEDLRARTDQTANELRESAMCLDQIGIIVRHSSEASSEAKSMSSSAHALAGEGGQLVTRVVQTMREIEASSARIGDIIGVVDSIAFQTNILALNAAVEAARAGEQGRGFAVVASEVRALAQRSAQAAREIKALVGASNTTVEHGTKLVSGAGQTMDSLVDSVRRVGDIFESINADTDDHEQGLRMVMRSMHDLTALTRENASVAERSTDIATRLSEQSARLGEVMQAFRLGSEASESEFGPLPAARTLEAAPMAAAQPPSAKAATATLRTPPTAAAPEPAAVHATAPAPAAKPAASASNVEFF
jgi:methyl-accepting chemotaxis protein